MNDDSQVSDRPIKVVAVLNPSKVVINRGDSDGLKRGQKFLVYQLGDEMFDPTTNESLGRLEIVRGRGQVVHLQGRMAHVASIESRTTITRNRNLLSIASTMGGLQEETVDEPFDGARMGDTCRPI
jgi:hypothetical protein